MPINDGGPAFPTPETDEYKPHDGMTLLDYFAARALQGYLANAGHPEKVTRKLTSEILANWSYSDAQAMIAERQRLMGGDS